MRYCLGVLISPASTESSPANARISVVFPAPFTPIKPIRSPSLIKKSIWLNNCLSPYALLRPCAVSVCMLSLISLVSLSILARSSAQEKADINADPYVITIRSADIHHPRYVFHRSQYKDDRLLQACYSGTRYQARLDPFAWMGSRFERAFCLPR